MSKTKRLIAHLGEHPSFVRGVDRTIVVVDENANSESRGGLEIYVARAFDHDAVHRDGVAGPNRKDVALGDGFEGHFLFLSIPHPPRGGRRELE